MGTPTLFVSVIVPFPSFALGIAAASCAVSAAVSVTEDTPAARFFVMVTLPNTSLSVCVQVDTGALIVTTAACPIVISGTLLKDDCLSIVVSSAVPVREPPVSVGVSYIVKDADTDRLFAPLSPCVRVV